MSDTTIISYRADLALPEPVPPPEPIPARFQWIWAPAIFGILTLAMFFDLLFTSSRVVSAPSTDLAMQFVPWRDFGFSQMSQGHLPLWNPHIYAGAPYFAGFQAALLYPPNWLHLILPLGLAINWIVALHVFFAGYFTYLWCRGRSIGIGGSIIAGVMFMFSGPYFLHLYAGHLPHLAVMIWAPLMLLSLDKLAETGKWKWCILGIVATSMHILAGHPQYVYYTGMALGIYTLLLMLRLRFSPSPGNPGDERLSEAKSRPVGSSFEKAEGRGQKDEGNANRVTGVSPVLEGTRTGETPVTPSDSSFIPDRSGSRDLHPSSFQQNPHPNPLPAYRERGLRSRWLTLGLGFVAIYFSAVLLTAVQLLPGIQAVGEEVRSNGTQYSFASTFSLPPQNLITFLVPTFFRNLTNGYWGAGYLWELSLFVSIAGLTLAIFAVLQIRWHRTWIMLTMLVITMILALGRHTPLYWPMFKYLPEYGSFRGTVKFAYLSVLFIAMLAAMGFDALRARRVPVNFLIMLGAGVLFVTMLGEIVLISSSRGPSGWWADFVRWVIASAQSGGEWFEIPNPANNPAFFKPAGHDAAMMCFVAAGTLIGVGLVYVFAFLHRSIPYLLLLIVCVEMFVFARITRATMVPNYSSAAIPPAWKAPLASMDKDDRMLAIAPAYVNLGMSLGYNNLNGYDPGVFKRYAEMFFAAEGLDPSTADQYLVRVAPQQLLAPPMLRLMRMFRCGLIYYDPEQPPLQLRDPPLPVARLMSDVVQLNDRDSILRYILASPDFDPFKTVVLESAPGIDLKSLPASPGSVRVVNEKNDSMEIQATLDRAAVLLITNNYSSGWRINPIASGQIDYRIMPANYSQIAIPLEKGTHDFVLEYSPLAFRAGCWISGITLIGLIGASLLLMRRRC